MFSSTNVGCSGQSEWELLSETPFSQLGSEERVSVKKTQREEQERRVEKRAQRAEERFQRAEERVQLEKKRVQRAEERVQQERKRAQTAEERVQRAEERVQLEKEGVQRAKERVQQERERAQQAEEREQRDREALGQRVRQAEARAAELQRRLDEVEGRERERLAVQQQAITAEQRGPSWEVGEGDVQRLPFKKNVQKGQDERVQQAGEAVVKMQAKSEAVEHHMTAGSIVATCLSIANTWSDL